MIDAKKSFEITAGIRKRFEDGTSNFANTKCFGYSQSQSGELVINEHEAAVVRSIFDAYLSGASVGKISKMLSLRSIPSPSGKDTWRRNAIDKMLSNEKYIGQVILQKTIRHNGKQLKNWGVMPQIQFENHHPPIIPPAIFEAVQLEKQKRGNVTPLKQKQE